MNRTGELRLTAYVPLLTTAAGTRYHLLRLLDDILDLSKLESGTLALAAQIAGKTGCKVMGQTYNPRMARGRGRFSIDRVPYVIELAQAALKNFKHIVLVEANDPVAFQMGGEIRKMTREVCAHKAVEAMGGEKFTFAEVMSGLYASVLATGEIVGKAAAPK